MATPRRKATPARRRRRATPAPARRRTTRRRSTLKNDFQPLIEAVIGGAIAGTLKKLPVIAQQGSVVSNLAPLAGGYVTQKFFKKPYVAAGMAGAGADGIVQLVLGGFGLKDGVTDYNYIAGKDRETLRDVNYPETLHDGPDYSRGANLSLDPYNQMSTH